MVWYNAGIGRWRLTVVTDNITTSMFYKISMMLVYSFIFFFLIGAALLALIIFNSQEVRDVVTEVNDSAVTIYQSMCADDSSLSVIEQEEERNKPGTSFVLPLLPIPIGEKELVKERSLILTSSEGEVLWTWNTHQGEEPFYLNRNIAAAYFLTRDITSKESTRVAVRFERKYVPAVDIEIVARCIRDAKQAFDEALGVALHSIVEFRDDVEHVKFTRYTEDGERIEIELVGFSDLTIYRYQTGADGRENGVYVGARFAVDSRGLYQLAQPLVLAATRPREGHQEILEDVNAHLSEYRNADGVDFVTHYTKVKSILEDPRHQYFE